jgi:hypothetical protein
MFFFRFIELQHRFIELLFVFLLVLLISWILSPTNTNESVKIIGQKGMKKEILGRLIRLNKKDGSLTRSLILFIHIFF